MAIFRFIRNAIVGGLLMYLVMLGFDYIGTWLQTRGNAPWAPQGMAEAFHYLAYIFRMPAHAVTLRHATEGMNVASTVVGFGFWGLIIAAMARAHEAKRAFRQRQEARAIETRNAR